MLISALHSEAGGLSSWSDPVSKEGREEGRGGLGGEKGMEERKGGGKNRKANAEGIVQ